MDDEFLDQIRLVGVMSKHHEQVRAKLPELFLKLVDRVERLEADNAAARSRLDELEHQVRRLKQLL